MLLIIDSQAHVGGATQNKTSDILVADDVGVAAIAAADAQRAVAEGVAREKDGPYFVARIKRGNSILDIYKLLRGR
jgi:regulator of RNase E activity RraA